MLDASCPHLLQSQILLLYQPHHIILMYKFTFRAIFVYTLTKQLATKLRFSSDSLHSTGTFAYNWPVDPYALPSSENLPFISPKSIFTTFLNTSFYAFNTQLSILQDSLLTIFTLTQAQHLNRYT